MAGGASIPMQGNPVGGGGQINAQIPMSGMQPVNPVQPMGVVDINAQQSKAKQREALDALADTELQKKADADRDRLVLDQYRASGGKGDMVTPDGIQTTIKEVGHRLSTSGYNNLADLYGKKKAGDLQLQKMLYETDKDKREQLVGDLEFVQGNLQQPMVEAFYTLDPTSGHYIPKEGNHEEQLAQFNDAKARALEIAKNSKNPDGSPKYPPASLKNIENSTPEQTLHIYESTSYFSSKVKETLAEEKTREEANLAKAKAKYLADRLKAGGEGGKQESKTMLIDGTPVQVNFHTQSGKYTLPTGEDVSDKVHPMEKGGLTPVQMGTVEKDIFEAKKFLERTGDKQTSSLFFLDQSSDKSAVRRFTENKLTKEESQIYDVYANRLANAIVGMQSLGRYRGAVKSIDEARKMVPSPGDTPATIKAKRDYIEEYTRDSDDELSKLSKNTHREKLMKPKAKPVALTPELSDEDMKLLDMYPAAPEGGQ